MKRSFLHKILAISFLTLLSVLLFPRARGEVVSGALTADNFFFAYVSTSDSTLGTLVAQSNCWGCTSTFSYSLTPGVTNYLHIEAGNYGGAAGFIGAFVLSDPTSLFSNGTQTLVTTDPAHDPTTQWLAGYNDGNSDPNSQQPWVKPTGAAVFVAPNGAGPWGFRGGISANANWIWPGDPDSLPGGNFCGNCTVDFSSPIIPVGSVPEPASMGPIGAVLAGLCLSLIRRRSIRAGR